MSAFAKETLGDLGLLGLRLGVGVQMVFLHGLDKFQNFAQKAGSFSDPLGIGSRYSLMATTTAELACAALIAVGLLTRLSAAALAFTMGVAAFVHHAGDPWKRKELAILYLAGSLAILLLGSGRFALDRVVGGRLFRRGAKSGAGRMPAARAAASRT